MKLISLIDSSVDQWFVASRMDWLTTFMFYFTKLAEAQVVAVLALASLLYFLWKKEKSMAWALFISVLGSAGTVLIMKHLIARPRPLYGVYAESLYSFPSAHAALAISFYGLFFYFLINQARKTYRVWLYILSAISIFLIGVSRLYLGVHYLSDVLVGHAVGVVWMVIAIWIEKRLNKKNPLS